MGEIALVTLLFDFRSAKV